MRRLISLLILLIIYNPSFADFKDVPKNHWAESSINNLVKLGITSGYPDDTFRGMQFMNRYEMAAMISNLLKSSKDYTDMEKIYGELRIEYETLKYKNDNPDSLKIKGSFLGSAYFGNPATSGEKGPKLNYRIFLSFFEKLGHDGMLKMNFDSLDALYNGQTKDVFPNMFDFFGQTKLGRFDLVGTFGPGDVLHRETDGVNYSDDSIIYSKPKPSLKISAPAGYLDLSLEYIALKIGPSGNILTNEVTANIAFTRDMGKLGKTTIAFRPRYIWILGDKDIYSEISVNASPGDAFTANMALGAGSTGSNSGLSAKLGLKYETLAARIALNINKVGGEYRKYFDKHEFVGLNYFNKYILDGSVDIGIDIFQVLNNFYSVGLKTDAVLASNLKYGKDNPGTSITTELSLLGKISEKASVRGFYRTYAVPSQVSSTDPQFAIAVPSLSSLLGIEFGLNF